MHKRTLMLAALVLATTGCSTGYRCDLGHDCTDAIEALEYAKTDGGNDESVFVEPEEYPEFSKPEDDESGSFEGSEDQAHIKQLGMGHLKAKPVFIPDSPMRIWIAPEKYYGIGDDPIYLVDGYHLYGVIKGGWLLGNKLKRNSNSSNSRNFGMIGPLDAKKNLGFKPTLENDSSGPKRKLFQ